MQSSSCLGEVKPFIKMTEKILKIENHLNESGNHINDWEVILMIYIYNPYIYLGFVHIWINDLYL